MCKSDPVSSSQTAQAFALPVPFALPDRTWPSRELARCPRFCAVDLRDGNQALPTPMPPESKKRYFRILQEIGFKEIEIGFPCASHDDWTYCRDFMTDDRISSAIVPAVLMPVRETLIRKTLKCLNPGRPAICHLYIPTSELHTKFVLRESPDEIIRMVSRAVSFIRENTAGYQGVQLEFSPEEFTDSDLNFVSELCQRVVELWNPAPGEAPVILNLPATVERELPTQYADRIEAFIRNLHSCRSQSVVSLHTHNDMGTAMAATELGLMAGAQRVEGTLFGQGERSGNVDLVTLGINLEYLGIPTGLNFSHIEDLRDEIVELTGIPVSPRHPYAGSLAFTAFSGTHQDAIQKGLDHIDDLKTYFGGWKLPYLHIDPKLLGRNYQDFIRINTQSGKSGIDFVLHKFFGVKLPEDLLAEFSRSVKDHSEKFQHELSGEELWRYLQEQYIRRTAPIHVQNFWPRPDKKDPTTIHAEVHLKYDGKNYQLTATDKGPVAAFAAAIRKLPLPEFHLNSYEERAIGATVNAEALTIVSITCLQNNKRYFGLGLGENIVLGATQAMISSINRLLDDR